MKWKIVSDSSCDLFAADINCAQVSFTTVPFIIRVDGREYIDDEQLNVLEMLADMESTTAPSGSACPSTAVWAEQFTQADSTIAITISGNLSGSLNSAVSAKDAVLEEHPDKQIVVLDSRSTGPEIALCIEHMAEWIKSGHALDAVVTRAQRFLDDCKTTFALSSFDHLVKNGRMNKLTGFVAKRLGMWGIGIASEKGTIAMKGKARGAAKAPAIILEDMRERGFSGGEVTISHCYNKEMAERLRSGIQEKWKTAKVNILKARGLDSFYAERGGLIVAFH